MIQNGLRPRRSVEGNDKELSSLVVLASEATTGGSLTSLTVTATEERAHFGSEAPLVVPLSQTV